jgi:hypothetical protein
VPRTDLHAVADRPGHDRGAGPTRRRARRIRSAVVRIPGADLRHRFPVDNRFGAGGLIAARAATLARLDGPTLLCIHSGFVTLQAMDEPNGPLNALRPIAKVPRSALVVTVRADVPYRRLRDLIGAVQGRPGGLSYASGGIGSPAHIAVRRLADIVGRFDVVHVPYNGAPEGELAVVAGDVDFHIGPIGAALPMLRSGRLRALAVTSRQRLPVASAGLTFTLDVSTARAGVVDPDCTAEKAAKSAATKATVGVGGRCTAGEAAKDSGKKAAGVEEKGPIEKQKKKDDTPAKKAKKAKDAVTKWTEARTSRRVHVELGRSMNPANFAFGAISAARCSTVAGGRRSIRTGAQRQHGQAVSAGLGAQAWCAVRVPETRPAERADRAARRRGRGPGLDRVARLQGAPAVQVRRHGVFGEGGVEQMTASIN